MWGLKRPTNVPKWIPWKSWCTKVLSSVGFAHDQGWRCTTAQLDGLVRSFVKNWNSGFLRCEDWKGLQISPNEYHECLGAWKFWVRWVLHMAKVGGAPRHSKKAWWGVLWKNEIRDFWDVRVGKAYKCPQMNTMKVLLHESFEFGVFCTWPSWSVHHGLARWLVVLWKIEIRGFWDLRFGNAYKCRQMNTMKVLVHKSFEFGGFCTWPRLAVHHDIARRLGGEFCEKMKFVIF